MVAEESTDAANSGGDDVRERGESEPDAPAKRSLLGAVRERLRGLRRPPMIVGAGALVLAVTAMLWSLNTSVRGLDESVQALTQELATVGSMSSAAESPAADAEQPSAPPPTAVAPAEPQPAISASSDSVEPAPKSTPEPPATLLGRPVVVNGVDVWDCVDFENWEQARLVYEANLPEDANILDFDANGVPCESLLSSQ